MQSTNHWTSSSSFGFSHQGSPQRIFHLQLLLSSVSSSVTPTSAMSSFTTPINLLFGLPRFVFPGNSILSIILPIYPSSFLSTCPHHLSPASRVFSPARPTCAVPLMYSFLILSILVIPNESRNVFNSATSISASCLFVSDTVSNPYNIAGLTATLYIFPLTLAGTRLPQITTNHWTTLIKHIPPSDQMLCMQRADQRTSLRTQLKQAFRGSELGRTCTLLFINVCKSKMDKAPPRAARCQEASNPTLAYCLDKVSWNRLWIIFKSTIYRQYLLAYRECIDTNYW